MFRPATRLIASSAMRAAPRATTPARRFLSTAPPAQKSRSWKSLAARIGAAGAIIYFYNTMDVFAEEPRHVVAPPPIAYEETESLPTIDEVAAARAKRKAEQDAIAAQIQAQQEAQAQADAAQAVDEAAAPAGSVQELEDEAGQQGAFNPETGEINWDCPCLGGMADGPCGPEFKAAFSCFVYSTEEPKGMDCIDKFKDMQGCFRKYPEIYGSELDSDAEDEEAEGALAETGEAPDVKATSTSEPLEASPAKQGDGLVPEAYRPSGETERANKATEQVRRDYTPVSESEQLVPKAAHDASDARVEEK